MSPFLRKVKTASGAVAVQIVEKKHGQRRILEHLGSAHSQAELAALVEIGTQKLNAGQEQLDLGLDERGAPAGVAVVQGSSSQLLIEVTRGSWERLGFGVIDDEAFFQLVLARLVEPTSKLDSLRVINELGITPSHHNTYYKALKRCAGKDYRAQLAAACFQHVWSDTGGDVSLLLYDTTTLYFEAEKEDGLRKVGYSKERRVDPQIVVGLLVDASGFPLEIACYEGSKAETGTIIPVLTDYQARNQVADMVVVADAGMLSGENLQAIADAKLRFIVGSRMTKAPYDLAKHFRWHGDSFTDGQIIDTVTMRGRHQPDPSRVNTKQEPVWNAETDHATWRAIWQYSRKRAVRDAHTLTAQTNRAQAIIDGDRPAKKARFVKTDGAQLTLDNASVERARRLAGLKGYVTNIETQTMPAVDIIASYHDLWRIEQSFRMSKTDLAARPIFHHTREAIEAHLTIVFAALAIARDLQARSGRSLRKLITTLRPLRQVTITISGHRLDAQPAIDPDTREILNALGH